MSLISIIIPVYSNSSSLPELAYRLAAVAGQLDEFNFEFIYVDDGSDDDSLRTLQEISRRDNRLIIIKLARNFGSNTAILAGMTYARGDAVGFIAADLQDPPETLILMINKWVQGSKVVLAVREDRQGDPWHSRIFANVFNWLFQKLVFNGFSPQGIGFFLLDRRVADVIISCEEKNVHLIGLILWSGYTLETVSYKRSERQHGKSAWTFGKKVKYFIDAFAAFSYLPLRIASALGVFIAFSGGIYAILLIILRLINNIQIQGWTALMVVILILSGIQLIILGTIGEYLWRNFDATRGRPLFIVDEIFQSSENG